MEAEERIDEVPGDGMPATTSDDRLNVIKDHLRQIVTDAEADVWDRRLYSEQIRYCIWENQNFDGKKHDSEDKKAFPFEGASDARIRTADEIINDRVRIMTAAATRFTPRAVGVESTDEHYGSKITALLRWVIKNKMRVEYRREIKKALNWQESDSPGMAVMGAFWHEEYALESKTVTLQELIEMLGAIGAERGIAEDDLQMQLEAFMQGIMTPQMDKENAALIQLMVPDVRPARAAKMVRELRENGQAEFPQPVMKASRPMIRAFRLFEDIWFPSYVGDIQRSPVIITREWLTQTELKERIISQKYDANFVEEALKHEGASFQPEYYHRLIENEWSLQRGQMDRKDQYEILTAWYRATNEDGVPGIYMIPFHNEVNQPARPETLLPYRHGKYPFTLFVSEVTTSRAWDSRGVPERVATDQQAEKLLHDASQDRTVLTTVPPIRVPRDRPRNIELVIKPLGQIPGKPGEYEWLRPPVNDGSNDNQQAAIKQRIDSYWCRPSQNTDPTRVQIAQGDLVDDCLNSLTEVMTQILQLCQQHMSEEDLMRVMNDRNIPIIRQREEIQGEFDLILSFDPRDMDMEWLKKKIEMYKDLRAIDVSATIRSDKLVSWLVKDLDPWMAEEIVESLESSSQREIDDEQTNFAKISAGVEPPMLESGQNFNLRLNWIQKQVQANPESVMEMKPISQQILKRRIEHLQFMVQQQQNAIIGRVGATPLLGAQI